MRFIPLFSPNRLTLCFFERLENLEVAYCYHDGQAGWALWEFRRAVLDDISGAIHYY